MTSAGGLWLASQQVVAHGCITGRLAGRTAVAALPAVLHCSWCCAALGVPASAPALLCIAGEDSLMAKLRMHGRSYVCTGRGFRLPTVEQTTGERKSLIRLV